MAIENCKNCKYFAIGNIQVQNIDEDKKPHCRRYAPRILCGSGEGWSGTKYPVVSETDWCGEWKERKAGEG